MKYKLKIVPQDGGYVGYALLNDEVVFTTNKHKDTVMASRELSNYVAQNQTAAPKPVPVRRTNSALVTPSATVQQSAPVAPVKKCCGRG